MLYAIIGLGVVVFINLVLTGILFRESRTALNFFKVLRNQVQDLEDRMKR